MLQVTPRELRKFSTLGQSEEYDLREWFPVPAISVRVECVLCESTRDKIDEISCGCSPCKSIMPSFFQSGFLSENNFTEADACRLCNCVFKVWA